MRNKIKLLRIERGLTQDQLATNAGISRTALSMLEKGKTVPDGNTVAKLVSALSVPANEIFFDFDVVRKQHEGVPK